jgi:hypothetical protein
METENLLICPRGDPDRPQSTLSLELTEIHELEARQAEVATANKSTCPELAKTFAYGWRETSKYAAWIEAEFNSAKQHLAKTKAQICLDEAPGLLQKKGLRVTADNVQFICDLDPKYQQAKDRLDQIAAYLELMKIKAKSFEMAYQSIKKIMGETRPDFLSRELNGTIDDFSNAGSTIGRNGAEVPGIGQARYNR